MKVTITSEKEKKIIERLTILLGNNPAPSAEIRPNKIDLIIAYDRRLVSLREGINGLIKDIRDGKEI